MKSMKSYSSSSKELNRSNDDPITVKKENENSLELSEEEMKEAQKKAKTAHLREEILRNNPEPTDGILGVCSSNLFDRDILKEENSESLNESPFTFQVPRCVAADHINLPGSEVPLSELMTNYFQGNQAVGLGLKRKAAQEAAASKTGTVIAGMRNRRKPKTLSEKRQFLQQDIMRYGVDAIEQMYPRQQQQHKKNPQRSLLDSPVKGMKMKPKPIGFADYEEIDVRKILKPNSHHKYIRDPLFDSVVYIERRGNRRDLNSSTTGGLVPLSTLVTPNSTTVLPSNCRLLSNRNKAMGKPKLFIKDKDGRLLAVGGSRYKFKDKRRQDDPIGMLENKWADKPLRVYTCPQPPVSKQNGWCESLKLNEISGSSHSSRKQNSFIPFEIDAEYASVAASAVSIAKINSGDSSDEENGTKDFYKRNKRRKKLDIRTIKRREKERKLANKSLKEALASENKSISAHIQEKLDAVNEALVEDIEMADIDSLPSDTQSRNETPVQDRSTAESKELIEPSDGSKNEEDENMEIENEPNKMEETLTNKEGVTNRDKDEDMIPSPIKDDESKTNTSCLPNIALETESVQENNPEKDKEMKDHIISEAVVNDTKKEKESDAEEHVDAPTCTESGQDKMESNQDSVSEENEKVDEGEDKKSELSEIKGFVSENPVHNAWSENKNNAMIPDTQTEKPVFTEDFKSRMNAIKELRPGPNEWLAGWTECDIEDCFCKEEDLAATGTVPDSQLELSTRNESTCVSTRADTGTVTPAEYASEDADLKKAAPVTSETETGPTSDLTNTKKETTSSNVSKEASMEQIQKRKVAKNLQKVRRALKTLGVNLYEMDDKTSDDRNNGSNTSTCEKECCRLGCICESIASKPVAPTHCGKVECMFRCCCSEEALKVAAAAALSPTGNRRSVGMGVKESNGISAEGCAAKLTRSSSSSMHRRLAAEEQKFNHSVVAATGGTSTASFLMLGATAGRQRRERKVPTRYQDSEAFAAESGSGFNIGNNIINGGGVLGGELDHDFDDFGCGVDGPGSAMGGGARTRAEAEGMKRMTIDNLRNDTIARCTVLLPMIKLPTDVDTRVWCMYHCQYRCPCSDYKNPLDYGPDLSRSRNVSKRTGSKVFITKKKKSVIANGIEPSDKSSLDSKTVKESQTIDRSSSKISNVKSFDNYPNARKIKIRKVNGKYVTSLNSFSTKKKTKDQLFNEKNSSSRTSGLIVRSNKSRMPHKIVIKKKKKVKKFGSKTVKDHLDDNPLVTDKEKSRLKMLANIPISCGEVVHVSEYSSPNIKSEGKQEEDESNDMVNKLALQIQNDKLHSSKLDLSPKSKGETQFLTWGKIRDLLQKRQIKLWCFYRSAIPVLFIANSKEPPYVSSAFDLQIMVKHNYQKGLPSDMPAMVRALLLNTLDQEDLDKYAILTYSGRAWEITGVLEKRVSSNTNKQKDENSVSISPKPEDSRDRYKMGPEKILSQEPIFENRGNIQPFRHHSKLTPPPPLRRKTSNMDPNPPVAIVQPQPQRSSYTKASLPGSNMQTQNILQSNVHPIEHSSSSSGAIPKLELPVHHELSQNVLDNSSEAIDNNLSCMVNVESEVEKLPSGKNLVTMVRGALDNPSFGQQQPTMQIKLPPTAPNQHWSIIRVDGNQGSVQCPDSTLALKVNVLRQAAELAMKEKTTVRIPIPVRSESDTFGVYAVPGLQTHVFVGPFSTILPQSGSNIQSSQNVSAASGIGSGQELIQISDSEDDEIKVIPPNQEKLPSFSHSTLSADKSNDTRIKETKTKPVPSEELKENEESNTKEKEDEFKLLKAKILQDKLQRQLSIRNAILAQVPQLIKPPATNEEPKEIDVIDITEDDDEPEKVSQPILNGDKLESLPYVNLEVSNYGKIVYRDKNHKEFISLEKTETETLEEEFPSQSKMISIEIPGYGPLKMLEKVRDKSVIFSHPSYENHGVMCPDSSSAVLWMNEFLLKQTTSGKNTANSPVKPKNNNRQNIPASKNVVGKTKPASSSNFKKLSRVERMASFRVENFNRKEHKEEVKLFHDLNKLIRRGQPRKATSIQILAQAKEAVEQLTADQVDLEQTKKALLRKRVTLFESFVQTLNGFPIAVKKRALLDTKEMLKKIKEQRGKDKIGTDMLPPPSPLQPIPTIKIEGVQTIKTSRNEHEEQTSQPNVNNRKILVDNQSRSKLPSDGPGGKYSQFNRLPAPSPSKVFGAGAPVVGIPAGLSNVSPLKGLHSPNAGQKPGIVSNAETLVTLVTSTNEQSANSAVSPSFITASGASVTPYSDVTGLQTVKKDGKLVRPMNAYMLWSKQYRRELISKGLDGATVSKLLAEEWHKLEETEKKKFYNQAEYLRKLHQEQHPDYKYSPKARKPRVSPRSSRDEKQLPTPAIAGAVPMEIESTIHTSSQTVMGQVVITVSISNQSGL